MGLTGNTHRKRGFTLLEVTIALAILAAALTTLLAGLNAGVLFTDRDRDYTIATFLAQEVMSKLERNPEDISSGYEEDGQFEDEFERYEWRVVVEPDPQARALAEQAGVPFEPLKATVTISWKYKSGAREYNLEQIFFPEVQVIGG